MSGVTVKSNTATRAYLCHPLHGVTIGANTYTATYSGHPLHDEVTAIENIQSTTYSRFSLQEASHD